MSDEKQVTLTISFTQLSILHAALQNEAARCAISNVLPKYARMVNGLNNEVGKLYDAELHLMTCESIKADAKETPIAAGKGQFDVRFHVWVKE